MLLRDALKNPEFDYGFRHVDSNNPLARFSLAVEYNRPNLSINFNQIFSNVNYLIDDIKKRGWEAGALDYFNYRTQYDKSDRNGKRIFQIIYSLSQSLRITDEMINGPEHPTLGRNLIAETEIYTASLYHDLLVELRAMVRLNVQNAREYIFDENYRAWDFFPKVIKEWRLNVTPFLLAMEDLSGKERNAPWQSIYDGLSFSEVKQIIAALRPLPPIE